MCVRRGAQYAQLVAMVVLARLPLEWLPAGVWTSEVDTDDVI